MFNQSLPLISCRISLSKGSASSLDLGTPPSKDCWDNYDIYLSTGCLYLTMISITDESLTLFS